MTSAVPTSAKIIAALANASEPEATAIASAFRASSNDGGASWDLLIRIFEMMLHPSDTSEPFAPVLITADGRSMIPADLTDEEVALLRPLVDEIDHPGFRARVGDVLWMRARDSKTANLAVEGYRHIALSLETAEAWVDAPKHFERGLRLAKQLDKNSASFQLLLKHILDRVAKLPTERDRLRRRYLSLLYEFRHGESRTLGLMAMETGNRLRAAGVPGSARNAFDLAAKFFHRSGDTSNAEVANIASAETYIDEAEGFEKGGTGLGALGALRNAILAFQKIPSCRDRIAPLQQRLRSAGKDTLQALQTIQIPFGDLKPMIQRVERALQGSTLEEALYKLAVITAPVDPASLRDQVQKVIAENPLHALFDTTVLDAAGRTVGVAPPALAGTDEERERGLRFHMHRHAGLHRDLACAGYIGPGLRIINDEHIVDEESIAAILVGHPLIPDGHENFFLRGITEGIRGDFAVALHLLIPQIENALRIILHANGVITSDLDQAGIELEWTLGRLISQDALKEAIGESLVFELGDLLTSESFGSNIRNTMAHGLLRYRALSTTESVYLWWIILRLIVETSPQFNAYAEAQMRARETVSVSEGVEPSEESTQPSLRSALDLFARHYSKLCKTIGVLMARINPWKQTS